MVGVLDYNVGNIANVMRALECLRVHQYIIKRIQTTRDIKSCDKIILPGVGAFKTAMNNLTLYDLDSALLEFAASGKYLLGICLGMQLLFERSYEFGLYKGLGLIKGEVVYLGNTPSLHANLTQNDVSCSNFDSLTLSNDSLVSCRVDNISIKIPHVGWNKNFVTKTHKLLSNLQDGFYLYFVHSYCVACENDCVVAECEYNRRFPSVVSSDNVLGIQPHPEKSYKDGLRILYNFLLL
ncbi:imidazole glycerol phosphate synthase subunit HisH [Helicobacter aurati]|uniref:Imidazole glycerol phosphate synthase subunit HisH n=1 Tax=Helicobacter aurati TaxID=137778 RepID=A0A3D8J2E8_9HELI|nr:imidazole glycerol phosphate synthase subunit HisH [Helicobacter aurati]RDU71034.1 imidazole glycerol phosphate synthase subunit HisH [Helicobacter aurati]